MSQDTQQSHNPTSSQAQEEQAQVIKISENTQREFSFKKMAIGWVAVILAIVVLCIVVEIAVHGW